jgi:hypothetical protein
MFYRTLALGLLTLLQTALMAAPGRQKFAIYLGGAGADRANSLAVDAEGNVYVAGESTGNGARAKSFLSKMNADGTEVLWSIDLPGNVARSVAIDGAGGVWVAGERHLARFRAADGQLDRRIETGSVNAIAIDAAGGVYAAGNGRLTKYVNFEAVYSLEIPGAIRAVAVDGEGVSYLAYGNVISRVAADGSAIDYTFDLGWAANAIAVDGAGAAYVTGEKAHVARVSPAGDALAFSVTLPGVLEQEGHGIALDGQGQLYVTGWTTSSDFAQARGWHGDADGFLVKMTTGGEVLSVDFAGTAARDSMYALAVSLQGDVFIAGMTEGSGLGSGRLAQLQGSTDAVVLKYANAGERATTGTTTTLSTAPVSTASLGQAVTLTATVSPAGPTGKVTFYDGVNIIGVGTLSGTTASVSTVMLPAGARSLRAYYNGDVNFSASLSAVAPFTVNVLPVSGFTTVGGAVVATGDNPVSTAVADFNKDGRPDLAIANYLSNSVSIFVGNGSGGFALAGIPLATGTGPINVVAGDFNGDGNADVAVANLNVNSVNVFLGNGAAGFSAASGSPFSLGGFGPISLAAADFNRDGRIDLVSANNADSTMSLVLGNGAGGFTAAAGSPISVAGGPAAIVAGDWNKDGNPDVAIANFSGNTVAVLLGNGTGGFTLAGTVAVGAAPLAIVTADFNADGNPDLAVSNFSGPSLSILLGNGTGGFSQAAGSPITVAGTPRNLAVIDFNADGKVDLGFSNPGNSTVAIYQGNGTGGFTQASGSPIAVGNTPSALVAGSFSGSGRTDLVVVNTLNDNFQVIRGLDAILPQVTSVNNPSGTNTETMIARFDHPEGVSNFSVVNILVNNFLDGRNACYLAYDSPNNVLYLVRDAGGGIDGAVLGSAGILANSQCRINTGASSAQKSGNTLILNLNIEYLPAGFAGRKVVWGAARDNANRNSGWVPRSVRNVLAAVPPPLRTVSITPAFGNTATQQFSIVYTNTGGGLTFRAAQLLINDSLDGRNACYLGYDRIGNVLYLLSDNGSTLLNPGIVPNSGTGSVENSQCRLNGSGVTMSESGESMTLGVNLTFKAGLRGPRIMYNGVQTTTANSGWEATGAWVVP